MRNKWYVIGIGVTALALAYGAFRLARGDSSLLAFVPGILAVALAVVAVTVARAASFAPTAKEPWEVIRPPAVLFWLKNRESSGPAQPTGTSGPSSAIGTTKPEK